MSEQSPNCFKCQYFYVTWDKRFPRGCKVYGFKGKAMPSQTVLESSGMPCKVFTPRLSRNR